MLVFFQRNLEQSLFLSLGILLLTLAGRIFGRRAAGRWRYICWTAVVLGLLVPARVGWFSLPVPVNQPAQSDNIALVTYSPYRPASSADTREDSFAPGNAAAGEPRQAGPGQEHESVPSSGIASSNNPAIPFKPDYAGWAAFIWLAGEVIFLCTGLYRHIASMRLLRRWSEPCEDAHTLELFNQARRLVGIKRNVRLVMCSADITPMTTGFFRPKVCLGKNVPMTTTNCGWSSRMSSYMSSAVTCGSGC